MAENSLVSLVIELAEIERVLIENEGALSPELEEKFNLTAGDIKRKADNYKIVCDALEARALYFKERADQFLHARKLFENQKVRLRENLKFAMVSMTTADLEGYDWRWKLSPMKSKLVIDEKLLPAVYMKEEKVMVPDRERIAGDLSLGIPVTGAHEEEVVSLRSYVNHVGRAKPVKGKSNE